jgi:predicted nucleic acid-binding Zn ribbon protein
VSRAKSPDAAGSGAAQDGPAAESEPLLVFQRFRRVFGDGAARSADARKRTRRVPGSSAPFGAGRDPQALSSVVDAMTASLGWDSPLAQSELLSSWDDVVGAETAAHSVPTGVADGVLTVRCDSTAWATQLRLMRAQVVTGIASRYPDAGILSVRFEGPNAPSWKRGPRSIPGRGPRDTYG